MQQVNNLSARIAKHRTQINASIDRVIASGWLVLGPEVKRFEQSFAAYLGASHCMSLANGTDAIELALKAMGIGPGDRTATVSNAGMYTTTALLAIGAEPYFMDVNFDTRGVTLAEVTRAVEGGVSAVVVTHLYGLAVPEIALIAEYCSQRKIPLLEDCAQAHGAQVNGQRVGTFGDAASFSFYPTKNLGALGDGGAVVTNNPKLAEKVGLLRQYGWTAKYKAEVLGARNSRLDEMQAAILSEFLPHLDEVNTRRREIAACYSALIRHTNIAVPHEGAADYVAHLYVIRSQQRDELREHLRSLNIASDVHYPIPDYRQPVFGKRFAEIHLQTTERLAKEILTLPCYPEMSDKEVDYVIAAVNGWRA
jgi:dTDP-3-amino-2,3,6-trideoxy-4-keto-D-glucose/dTDP-3-amino-3,4,6-trideoxy-alpha-D-glucose/dTDP-2,6-dideoxy-D-kanosamine transaminase